MVRSDRLEPAAAPVEFESLKNQRIIFTFLNLFLLAVLLILHASFASFWGAPSGRLASLLAFCSVIRGMELVWLRGRTLHRRVSVILTAYSISLNLVLAVILSSVVDREDSQYAALLVIPILEAAFRFGLPQAVAVAVMSNSITFYWVWRYGNLHPPVKIGEYFEAGTQSIVFLIVAVLVSILVRYLRGTQMELASKLKDLETTRNRLLQEEKLAAIGRLSSALAHEIRNPVAMISSSLATAKCMAGSDREEMFGIAGREASRLVTLTNDLLAYARPRHPQLSEGTLADCVTYVADVCRAYGAEKGVSLRVEASGNEVAEYDTSLLEQSLMNLVKNAIEASPFGAEVLLAVRTDESHAARIEVENNGGPIPAKTVERLFEPFFTTKPAGTGLGLATAYNAARVQGGDLLLSRNTEKVCFSLVLPAHAQVG